MGPLFAQSLSWSDAPLNRACHRAYLTSLRHHRDLSIGV